jgi:hypothetical protein
LGKINVVLLIVIVKFPKCDLSKSLENYSFYYHEDMVLFLKLGKNAVFQPTATGLWRQIVILSS